MVGLFSSHRAAGGFGSWSFLSLATGSRWPSRSAQTTCMSSSEIDTFSAAMTQLATHPLRPRLDLVGR
jgi:hypothetical protein